MHSTIELLKRDAEIDEALDLIDQLKQKLEEINNRISSMENHYELVKEYETTR